MFPDPERNRACVADNILADCRKCVRDGIEAARWSMTTCTAAGLRGADTLAPTSAAAASRASRPRAPRGFLAAASVRDERMCRV